MNKIVTFFKRLWIFMGVQTPSAIAQRSLEVWSKPDDALRELLEIPHATLPTLQALCIIWEKIGVYESSERTHLLYDLLLRFPIEAREHALRLATNNDPVRITILLIAFAPHQLEGLTDLATQLKNEWDQQQRYDDLALAFYDCVPAYGVSADEAMEAYVRVLITTAQYEWAEMVLLEVFTQNPLPSADLSWSLFSVQQCLKRSSAQQISTLEHFILHCSADHRLGQAWYFLGDLYGSEPGAYQRALDAYFHAEQSGISVPPLQAYRAGNWDTLPALRLHPDYLFPPLVAIDLEVDALPGAAKGSRVFEIGAACYKGQTCLEEYHSYIQRPFSPVKWTHETAIAVSSQ